MLIKYNRFLVEIFKTNLIDFFLSKQFNMMLYDWRRTLKLYAMHVIF